MRLSELLRGFVDILDRIEQEAEREKIDPQPQGYGSREDVARFKQIKDMYQEPEQEAEFSNEPNEQYASVDAVTKDAGGGANGPKHPHNIRVKDPSQHPGNQES